MFAISVRHQWLSTTRSSFCLRDCFGVFLKFEMKRSLVCFLLVFVCLFFFKEVIFKHFFEGGGGGGLFVVLFWVVFVLFLLLLFVRSFGTSRDFLDTVLLRYFSFVDRFPFVSRDESSAKRELLTFLSCGCSDRSMMNIHSRTGRRTLPCRTPVCMVPAAGRMPSHIHTVT